MSKTYLILDCNFLCHRAKHSMGGLSRGDGCVTGLVADGISPSVIIYLFFKTVHSLQEQFQADQLIFCWDSKTSKRKEIYPEYKAQRANKYKDMDEDEIALEKEFRLQMKILRKTYLKEIGYKNVFCQKGYEGDDIIASVCQNSIKGKDEAIIITSDKDMYQLIRYNITFYNMKKKITLQSFKKEYGISPDQWSIVKAAAGCTTDNVKGIKGVGELTAIKSIKRTLKETSKVYKRMVSDEGRKIFMRNDKLVTLPFKGTKTFKLKKDVLSDKGWKDVCKKLGMKSIKDKLPRKGRR